MSLIKNKASLNEELDPSLIIKRLKEEILTLREEIVFLKVGGRLVGQPLREPDEYKRVYSFSKITLTLVCAMAGHGGSKLSHSVGRASLRVPFLPHL